MIKCFPIYLYQKQKKYYKYVEKHFVKAKICPYICTFLNRFLEALRGGIRNPTFYAEF